MDNVFILESAHGKGEVFFRTTEGGIATFIFRTKEGAVAYLQSRGRQAEWRVREMTQPEWLEWIKEKQVNGLTDLVANPAPESDDANQKVVPVRAFLLRWDLETQ